jgi:predicted nuclease of predicted toxin-antitoxin system
MRFLADMGISPVTVTWLNEQGHDARHLSEDGLHTLSDREIFDKAGKEDRIILTTDLDFGEIAMSAGSSNTRVKIFRQENRTPTVINLYLEKAIAIVKKELADRAVVISVQEDRIRVRHLSRD